MIRDWLLPQGHKPVVTDTQSYKSSETSQNSQERLCLSISLASSGTFWDILNLELPTALVLHEARVSLKRKAVGCKQNEEIKRKNAVNLFWVLAHAWIQKLFDLLTLSDVRKTSPFLLRLNEQNVFLSSAMARVLTITTLSFDWLMWQSRIISFFILNDPSHRKQDSGIAK